MTQLTVDVPSLRMRPREPLRMLWGALVRLVRACNVFDVWDEWPHTCKHKPRCAAPDGYSTLTRHAAEVACGRDPDMPRFEDPVDGTRADIELMDRMQAAMRRDHGCACEPACLTVRQCYERTLLRRRGPSPGGPPGVCL